MRGSAKKQGFVEIEDWKSCFWHPALKVFLVLYVDDFKLVGPQESMEEAWKMIRQDIVTGDPRPLTHFLGCTHEPVKFTPEGSNKEVNGQIKNMEGFFRKCVETFQHLAGEGVKMKVVPTPFIKETSGQHTHRVHKVNG